MSKAKRVGLILAVILYGAGILLFMLYTGMQNLAEAQRQEQRTEADFISREYVLKKFGR